MVRQAISTSLLILFYFSMNAQCWTDIVSGDYHALALQEDGTLWSWGSNRNGQLGNSSILNENAPIKVNHDTDWAKIFVGNETSFAIKKNGTLWAWGDNSRGQLGIGSNNNYKTHPLQVRTDSDWMQISSGLNSTYGIKQNGTLWSWGNVPGGPFDIPIQFGTESNWKTISVGEKHVLAIKTDGTLWAWGGNDYGQIGNGKYDYVHDPIQISTANNWTYVNAGITSSIALDKNKTLWVWGKINFDQNASGLFPKSNYPNFAWNNVVSNGYHFLGINPKTSLFTWGNNESGQLGSDTKKVEIDPVQLTRSTKFKKVALGKNHSYVLKDDGYIWATGGNLFGQLGIGNNTDVSTLTAIYCLPVNSVLDKTFSSEISIYPNPAHNLIRIELGQSNIELIDISICDLNGKSIYAESLKKPVDSKNQQKCIDLSSLPSGLYYIKVNSNKGTIIKKIIKN